MRLPWTKLYRGFPELDRFSDDQCEAWLGRLWGAAPAAMWASVGVPLAVGLLAASACVQLGFWFLSPMLDELGQAGGAHRLLWQWLAVAAWVALVGGPGGLVALVLRDRIVRRIVKRQLKSRACMKCGYSLLGLPVTGGTVVCAECGGRVTLADRGLTAADLISQAGVPAASDATETPPRARDAAGMAERVRALGRKDEPGTPG